MGSILQARCAGCGLDQRLSVGGGMRSFMTIAAVPAGCDSCHRVVMVNAKLAPRYPCPTNGCAGSAVIIGQIAGPTHDRTGSIVFDWLVDDEARTRYQLGDQAYRCPACGASSLTFAVTGSWD